MDRALRLADKRSFPANRARWMTVRDALYEEIMRDGWSPRRQASVPHYGSESLDAANLVMPLALIGEEARSTSALAASGRRR